jgi:ActR/RegA family two-component response regulator
MLEPIANSLLIVEDDELLCHCPAHAIEEQGFRVTSVATIAKALIQIESDAPRICRGSSAAVWRLQPCCY